MKELPINQVVHGDAFTVLKEWPEESIDLVMFSPPYWGLRDYGVEGQMGLEDHPNLWIEKMVELCSLLRRVLKKRGSLYLNVGDTYFSSTSHSDWSWKDHDGERWKWGNKGEDKFNVKRPAGDGKWLQPKQLLLMPSRLAITLQDDGWILRNDICWRKDNHMPSSVKDRLTNSWEHIFHFVKARRYFYDLDSIRVSHSSQISKPSRPSRSMFSDKVRTTLSRTKDSISPITEKLLATIKTSSLFTSQTSNVSTAIRDKFLVTINASSNKLRLDRDTKLLDVVFRFHALVTNQARNDKVAQVVCGVVVAELPKRDKVMDKQRNIRRITFLAFEIRSLKGKQPLFLPINPSISNSTTTPIRIILFDPISGTPNSIATSRAKIMFQNGRLEFSNGFSAIITFYDDLAKFASFLGCPTHNLLGNGLTTYKSLDWNKILKERAKQGGAQRQAYEFWLKWKKNHPNGTFEEFYKEVSSKNLSKWQDEKWQKGIDSTRKRIDDVLALGKNPSDTITTYQGKFNGFGEESEKFGSPRARTQRQKKPYQLNDPHRMREENESYVALNPERPNDLSHALGKNPSDLVEAFKGHPPTNYYKMGESPMGKNPSDFWNVNTKPFKGAHFAVYPEKICRMPIKSSCPKDGIVLDPMCGSGTTCVVAHKLGRRWVGIELNHDYVELAKKRLEGVGAFSSRLEQFAVAVEEKERGSKP